MEFTHTVIEELVLLSIQPDVSTIWLEIIQRNLIQHLVFKKKRQHHLNLGFKV